MTQTIPIELYRQIAEWLIEDCPKGDLINLCCVSSAWQAEAEGILWTNCCLNVNRENNASYQRIHTRFSTYIKNITIWIWDSPDWVPAFSSTDPDLITLLEAVSHQLERLTIHARTSAASGVTLDILDSFSFPMLDIFHFTSSRSSHAWLPDSLPAFFIRHSIREFALYDQGAQFIMGALDIEERPLEHLEVLRTTVTGALAAAPLIPDLRELIMGHPAEDVSEFLQGDEMMNKPYFPKLRVLHLPEDADNLTSRLIVDPEYLPLLEEVYNFKWGDLFSSSEDAIKEFLIVRFTFPHLRVLTSHIVARNLTERSACKMVAAIRSTCPRLENIELTCSGDPRVWVEETYNNAGQLCIKIHRRRGPTLSTPSDLESLAYADADETETGWIW